MRCHACGNTVRVEDKVFRSDTCPGCGRPLRCCKNCLFFDPTANNQCRESQAELVGDKEAANFCDYFRPRENGGEARGGSRSAQARKKIDDLFKKK